MDEDFEERAMECAYFQNEYGRAIWRGAIDLYRATIETQEKYVADIGVFYFRYFNASREYLSKVQDIMDL